MHTPDGPLHRSSPAPALAGALVFAVALIGTSACLEPFPDSSTPQTARAEARRARLRREEEQKKKRTKRKKKKKKQSYRQAWKLICRAPELAKLDGAMAKPERDFRLAEWISQHVKNRRARYWFLGFGKVKRRDQPQVFRDEVKAVGIPRCPLDSLLFSGGTRAASTSRPSSVPLDTAPPTAAPPAAVPPAVAPPTAAPPTTAPKRAPLISPDDSPKKPVKRPLGAPR